MPLILFPTETEPAVPFQVETNSFLAVSYVPYCFLTQQLPLFFSANRKEYYVILPNQHNFDALFYKHFPMA